MAIDSDILQVIVGGVVSIIGLFIAYKQTRLAKEQAKHIEEQKVFNLVKKQVEQKRNELNTAFVDGVRVHCALIRKIAKEHGIDQEAIDVAYSSVDNYKEAKEAYQEIHDLWETLKWDGK